MNTDELLEAMRAALQALRVDYQSGIAELRGEVADLRKAIADVPDALGRLRARTDTVVGDVRVLEVMHTDLTTTVQEFAEGAEAPLLALGQRLEGQTSNLTQQIAALAQRVDTTERDVVAVSDEIVAVAGDVSAVRTYVDTEIKAVCGVLELANLRMNDISGAASASVQHADRDRQEFRSRFDSLDERLGDMTASTHSRLAAAEDRADAQTRVLDGLAESLETVNARVDAQVTVLGQVHAELVETHGRVAEMTRASAETAQHVGAIASRVLEQETELKHLTGQLGGMSDQIETRALVGELGAVESDLRGLSADVRTLKGLATRVDTLEQVLPEVETLRGTVAEIDREFDENERVLEGLTMRVEGHAEQIRQTNAVLAQHDEHTASVLDALRSAVDAVPDQIHRALAPVQASCDGVLPRVAELASWREAQDDYLLLLRDLLVERYQPAEPWARGGPAYKDLATVTHRGGLWQALTRTSEEPGPDAADWMLLADGVAGVTVDPTSGTEAVFTVQFASGRSHDWTFRAPVPRFRGVYDPATQYEPWDTVAKDARVFMALVDAPAAPGEVLGQWQVMTGPAGKGRRGQDGRDGPTVGEVIAAVREPLIDDVVQRVVPILQDAVNRL